MDPGRGRREEADRSKARASPLAIQRLIWVMPLPTGPILASVPVGTVEAVSQCLFRHHISSSLDFPCGPERRATPGTDQGDVMARRRPMRPDLERRLLARLDALGPAPRAELLHVLMLPDFERVLPSRRPPRGGRVTDRSNRGQLRVVLCRRPRKKGRCSVSLHSEKLPSYETRCEGGRARDPQQAGSPSPNARVGRRACSSSHAIVVDCTDDAASEARWHHPHDALPSHSDLDA